MIYPREKAAEHLSQEGTITTGRHDYIIFQPFIPSLDSIRGSIARLRAEEQGKRSSFERICLIYSILRLSSLNPSRLPNPSARIVAQP